MSTFTLDILMPSQHYRAMTLSESVTNNVAQNTVAIRRHDKPSKPVATWQHSFAPAAVVCGENDRSQNSAATNSTMSTLGRSYDVDPAGCRQSKSRTIRELSINAIGVFSTKMRPDIPIDHAKTLRPYMRRTMWAHRPQAG